MVCSSGCAIEFTRKSKENSRKILRKVVEEDTAKKRRADLQVEVNKLSRMIDAKFGYKCIDCGSEFGKKVDAAHYHSRGANNTIRYNLHNLHSARSHCNLYSDTHKEGYYKGLKSRYGEEYANYVKDSLPIIFERIKLLDSDIKEKLKIVRKLIRTFPTLQFKDGVEAREKLNKIIGIYRTE